jgi:hypothetical protein
MKFLVTLAALSLNAYIVSASICAWTPSCYGTAYGESYACGHDFPDGGKPTGKARGCDGAVSGKQFECCGITKVVTNECKWSYCAGALIAGQTTCNDLGADWRYSGKSSKSDCGFWSTNSKVECCKLNNV